MKPKDSQEQFVRNLIDCQPSLYAHILSLLPNRDDAADVLQDTNLVMWRRSDEYVEGTNFLAWAHKIVRFKVLAHHRNRRRDRHIFDDSLFDLLADEAEGRAHDRGGITDTLDDCMAELPPAQCELVRQRYAPGASLREMAQTQPNSGSAIGHTIADPQRAFGVHPAQAGREVATVTTTTPPNDCNELTQLVGELVDDQLTDARRDRFLQLLRNNPSARNYYLDYMELHARLQWRYTGVVECEIADNGPKVKNGQRELERGEKLAALSGELFVQDLSLDHPRPSPAFPLLTTTLPGTVGFFSSGWPVAYLVATVICGVGMLIGSLTPTSQPEQVARQPSVPRRLDAEPKTKLVGRITGMVDCKWAGTAFDAPSVPLGRKYELASGLMEITYDTGAKVILQGPVKYSVESAAGGYLAVGRLTARVEKKSRRCGAAGRHRSSVFILRSHSHRHGHRPGHGVRGGGGSTGARHVARFSWGGGGVSGDGQ